MILVRDVFRLKYGKAKDAKALLAETKKLMEEEDIKNSRSMFDLVGPSYTLVWETTHKNLAEFEGDLSKTFAKKEWGEWYQKFVPLIESSYREIFTLVE